MNVLCSCLFILHVVAVFQVVDAVTVLYDDFKDEIISFSGKSGEPAEHFVSLVVGSKTLLIGATKKSTGKGVVYKGNLTDDITSVAEYVVVDPCAGDTSCQSYIKVLLEIPPSNDDLLVCGSTTVISKYDCYNVSSSNSLTTSIDPEYICSVHYLENTTAVIDTDDGKLYTALVYNGVRDRTIGRAPSYIEPVDIFSVAADEWIGEEPSFISSYTETVLEDWVLFFFREVALESETRDIYSRMAKVCKDDNGGNSNVLTNNWATYQKARLQCENKYYYNVLLDTALSADGQTIYAAFIANENGVPRPAVCSYDLTQAVPVFENQQYYSQDTNTDQWEKVVTTHDPYPGECDPDTKTLSDAILNDLKKHPLMYDLVPSEKDPILTSYIGVKFTQILVTEVPDINNTQHKVIYIGTDRGSILKVLFDDEYVIEETYVTEEAKPVPLMKLSETYLYLAFDDQVIQVPMQYCERHTNCYSCVTARDPHCSWDTESSTCVNGGDNSGKFLQNVSGTGGSGLPDVSETTTVTGNEGMAVILPFKLPVDVMVKKENNDVNIDNAKYILVIGVGLVITNLELSDSATYNFTAKADGTLLASFYLIVKTNKCIENVVSCQNRKVFLFCCAHTESNFTWSPIVDGSPLTETHTECNNKISWLSIIVTPDTNTTYTCKITPLDGSSTKNYEATVTLQECVTAESIDNQIMRYDMALEEHTLADELHKNNGTCEVPYIDCADCSKP